jgi:carboxypeptidase T
MARTGRTLFALTFSLLLTTTTAAAAGTPAPDSPLLWRIPLGDGGVTALSRAGFDVVSATGGDATVVGDAATAKQLRALGYRPSELDTVYKGTSAEAARGGTFYGGYRTVAAHEKHIAQVARSHPRLVTRYDIGDSWLRANGRGGHEIQALCLTAKRPGDCSLHNRGGKPKFVLMAQSHAREITTSELAERWIDYLVDGYHRDADATAILDSTEVWVVPLANPDGTDIVASGGDQPVLQRKNADDSRGDCTGTDVGVDLNRNSTFKWGGDSPVPCEETYQGPRAGSEPETRALERFFRGIYPDQRGPGDTDAVPPTARGTMITLHSAGNDIIVPWGWSDAVAPNDARMRELGREMAAGNGYAVGANSDTVGYTTPGTTDDFTYGELGVASFTVEVGPYEGDCGGFFPRYSCIDDVFWPQVKGSFVVAAKAAAAPYAQH